MIVTVGAARPRRARRVAELNELAGTTPGVLVPATVLVGVLTALGVRGRASALDDLAQWVDSYDTWMGPLLDVPAAPPRAKYRD